MTRIIDRLEHAGLVTRQKSSRDKRVVNVSLTDAGHARLAEVPELLQTEFLRKFRRLEEWEQHMLRSSIMRIAVMMDADDLEAAAILQPGALDAST